MSLAPSRAHRRKAFTLVELLVVIAIIALLISILLPALKRAKESGNSVKCMADMKQIMMALMMYATDNRNEMILPPLVGEMYPGTPSLGYYMSSKSGGKGVIRYDAGAFWKYLGKGNMGTPTPATEKAAEDGVFARIFNCPSDTDFRAVRQGSIDVSASFNRNFSYSWNIQIRQDVSTTDRVVRKLNQVKQPAMKALLIEEATPNDGMAYIMMNNMDDVPAFRHNGNANYGFADGHVQSVNPTELGFERLTQSNINRPPALRFPDRARAFFLLSSEK
ncbi:MAG TPA: prepilin-type N-terminal cleavage/methylation domain-containing protein [Tepidisphaeraceae bacterium]|nr:prepilin-type N-terminal cleavage/methylation domain-containing protein [Tepidisphaeraceae bacterium]